MKKRFTAFSLTFVMLIGQIFGSGMTALAGAGSNAYGHTVTYQPVTQLYTAGEPIRFFDAQVTDWGTLSEKITRNEANSIKWLSENGYLLNHFGRKIEASGDNTNRYVDGCFNAKGEWQTKLQGPNQTGNGQNYTSVNLTKLFYPKPDNGNIYNMYDKGDLQYFFSWKVKTVQTSWALTSTSNDYGDTYALRGWTRSIGGGWMKYNTLGDGPNLFNSAAWKPGKNSGWYISFVGMSDKDKRVDSYLSGAMLVGRDVKGPSISSVRVTSDIEGKKEIENGAITLDTINDLKNRTVYFQVEWDEPVAFRDMTEGVEALSLSVETLGIDGTSGMIAEAPFLKFAPSKNDAKPVMVFEYQIADPYTDSSAVVQERGYFYKFSKVTVSSSENKTIWNHIYDISGNKFAADENGSQPASKVACAVSGSPYVDLMPFGIENIRMTKDENDGNAFVKAGGLLGVTLELNKAAKSDTKVMDLPVITLNIKDEGGQYITVRPSEDDLRRKYRFRDGWKESGYFYGNSGRLQPVMLSADKKSIAYYVQLIPGYTMDGDSIKVIAVSSDKEKLKDASGYSFMDYELINNMLTPTDIPSGAESKTSTYSVSPDKQYRIDFEEPIITLSAHDEGEGIILITASIDDNSIEGCDVAFSATVNGSIADGQSLSYQASSGENYDNTKWIAGETGTMTAAFGAPVMENGNAYGFIKLPENCEANQITVSAVVVDEAENSASAQTDGISVAFDKLAPTVVLSVKDETVTVAITDMSDDVTYSYGFSENETDAPSYTEGQGKIGTISAPDDFPEGENKVYTRVLWITATDSNGNESEIIKLPVEYDRTFTDIIVTSADTSKQYLTGENPIAFFNVKNAKAYWCTWAEKPANTADTAAYIAENCLDDMKTRAETYGITFKSDDDSTTDFTNRLAELASFSRVAAIDPATELYGEDVTLAETSRPIMLVIGAVREDGTTLVKTVEFDTFYGAPKAGVIQNRFSSNNSQGKRVDYIEGADTAQLLLANDSNYEYPLNTPSLYGFAQAEFKLSPDRVTGITRVDLGNSSITLEKVVYNEFGLSSEEKSREVVQTWRFSEIGLKDASGSAIVDIDPKSIATKYYEISTDEYGDVIYYPVRYEFVCNMSYNNGSVGATKTTISYFAFNNEPTAFLHDAGLSDEGHGYQDFKESSKQNIEAVFDENGNDITSNVPVYTVRTKNEYFKEYQGAYICFSPEIKFNSCDSAFYCAPVINITDETNTSKLSMRIGTDPKLLSETLLFTAEQYGGVYSGYYDVGQYFSGNDNKIDEVKLYYRFEYPERGTTSPVYVMTIRRDDFEPVFDLSVSETERLTSEVSVKLNALYDIQTAADGTVVVDTTESELRGQEDSMFRFDAFQEITKSEYDALPEYEGRVAYDDHYEPYKYYAPVRPGEDGIYRFTSNGFIDACAVDNAGNYISTVLVNGKKVPLEYRWSGQDFPMYYIDNVSNVAPEWVEEPVFTEGDGKFSLSAKADKTVKNVYLKFNKEYSQMLSESDSEGDDVLYSINNLPGLFSGGFDSETGNISAEIYVKHSETVSLSAVTVVIENSTGNKTEYTHNFTSPIYGSSVGITNTKNENGYPVYNYGETLDFSVPVKLNGASGEYALSHSNLAIYSDGISQIEYTDLFGESKIENIYADIFGAAFAHELKFTAGGKEITPQTKVSSDVTITIDTKGASNLTVDGKREFTFAENGTLTYSLVNSEIGKKTFNVPVTNIDKTPPEAIVTLHMDSERDAETNEQHIYSVTYSVEGFSEDGVTMIPSEDGAAPASVTFDGESELKTYTFRFRDEAGNEGLYTVDASDIAFAKRSDDKITDYRLTYMAADKNGFITIGQFKAGDEINLGLINKVVSVKIEALNANGETVSATVAANGDLPNGASLYAKEKLVMFTTESDAERIVSLTLTGTGSGNSKTASVVLPANTIDLTAPTGTVYYKADGNNVKAYLVTQDTDLAENGVYVTGTRADGTAFELKSDENGYYTEFDTNGTGRFVLLDKAGNTGTVTIAVLTIDNEPPKNLSEGWQSVVSAKTQEEIKKLLETPTNSTIKLFITFNEQLSGAKVKAYETGDDTKELTPTEDYVTAAVSGNAITVEFINNCRAMLTVYDLRGNALVLWRPEDGPITVIDRDVPKLLEGYPTRTVNDNKVTLQYIFADGEEVMLLQDHNSGYRNEHTVTFSDNGTQILNFADKAGNVFSDYPVITEVDILAPNIKMSTDFVGEGFVLSGNDSYKAGNLYTSKNVRILLNVEDVTSDGITVTAKAKSGAAIEVKKENATVNEKSYNYNFTVSENGSYTVTAKDKWGNENSVEASVSIIDKTPPTIKFIANTAVVKVETSEVEAKNKIMENIAATDLQSGANSPMGDYFGEVADGVALNVDLSKIKLDKPGQYAAKITATDRLGNYAEKDYTVNVVRDVYTFKVNGSSVYANDVYTASKGKITIENANETAKYYYAQGYKTAAQMKYAKGFDPEKGFDALQNGYYTVLVQEQNRKMYLLYVYIN